MCCFFSKWMLIYQVGPRNYCVFRLQHIGIFHTDGSMADNIVWPTLPKHIIIEWYLSVVLVGATVCVYGYMFKKKNVCMCILWTILSRTPRCITPHTMIQIINYAKFREAEIWTLRGAYHSNCPSCYGVQQWDHGDQRVAHRCAPSMSNKYA